jgi:RHS repeat-associated protein
VAWASYAYDAFGNRISMSVQQNGIAALTLSSYQAVAAPQVGADLTNWHLWADLSNSGGGNLPPGPQPGPSGSNVVQTRYISGEQPDQWFARVDISAGVNWYGTDYQGSIRFVTDTTGAVLDSISYDAYGAITTETNPTVSRRFGLDGYQWDSWTTMYDDARRYYLADARRFMTQDPMGLAAGPNPNEYVNDAPTNGTDPTGQWLIASNYAAARNWGDWFYDNGITIDRTPLPSGIFSSTRYYIDIAPGQEAKLRALAATVSGLDADKLIKAVTAATGSDSRYQYQLYSGDSQLYHTSLTYKENAAILQYRQKEYAGMVSYTNPGELNSTFTAGAKGFGEGLADGAVIVGNQLTFKMIPGLDAQAKKLIADNGGAYEWSNLCGEVAREALTTAATMGAGSAVAALGKLPGLAKLGGVFSKGATIAGKAVPQSVGNAAAWVACKIVAPAAGVLKLEQTGEQVAKVGQALVNAYALAHEGKDQEAVRELVKAGFGSIGLKQGIKDSAKMLCVLKNEGPIGLYKFLMACFAAGTPLETPEGSKAIEKLVPGDILLSRHENDPEGRVEAKVVVEVFWRTGRIHRVRVNGRDIRTTAEHPFYVLGKGWVEAGLLQPGDLICSRSGQRLVVEEVEDTGKYETVYNVEVADFHTYFVGCREWGWSAWAHNAGSCKNPTPITDAAKSAEKDGEKLSQKEATRVAQVARKKMARGNSDESVVKYLEGEGVKPDMARKAVDDAKRPAPPKVKGQKQERTLEQQEVLKRNREVTGPRREQRMRAAIQARKDETLIKGTQEHRSGTIYDGFDGVSYKGTGKAAQLYINDSKGYRGAVRTESFGTFGLSKAQQNPNPPRTLPDTLGNSKRLAANAIERAFEAGKMDRETRNSLLAQLNGTGDKKAIIRVFGTSSTPELSADTAAALQNKTGWKVQRSIEVAE